MGTVEFSEKVKIPIHQEALIGIHVQMNQRSTKTAWKAGHAVRGQMKLHGYAIDPLEGVVELGEKYLGGKPRFVQSVSRQRHQEKLHTCRCRAAVGVEADVVPGDSYPDFACRVAEVVSPGAHLMTDQLPINKEIGKGYEVHESVNHGLKSFAGANFMSTRVNLSTQFSNEPNLGYSTN